MCAPNTSLVILVPWTIILLSLVHAYDIDREWLEGNQYP